MKKSLMWLIVLGGMAYLLNVHGMFIFLNNATHSCMRTGMAWGVCAEKVYDRYAGEWSLIKRDMMSFKYEK